MHAKDMKDPLDGVEASLDQLGLDLKKQKSVQVAQMEALQQKLRSAKADILKAREDLKALDVKSAISGEMLKLSLEEAIAAHEELAREVPLTVERQRADLA